MGEGFPDGPVVRNLPANAEDIREGFVPCVRKTPWRRKWQSTLVLLPGESMDRGAWWATYSPWGCKELNVTE